MSKIPGGAPIVRALKGAKRAVKASLKEIRDHASKQLSKGNYAGAEALVEVARAVDGFQRELDGLITRWKNVRGSPAAKTEYTPMWEYYEPVLRALDRLGGTAGLDRLLPEVERQMDGRFRPGDRDVMVNGRERWQVMVRRARKPMVTEGFLEATKGAWTISPAGRRSIAGKSSQE